MIRFGGPVGLLLFLLWVYCIIDVIATDSALVRNLPKMAWLFLVIILSAVGSVAWLALGRPQFAGWWPGDTRYRTRRSASWGMRGPDDDPSFMSSTARTSPPTPPTPPPAPEAAAAPATPSVDDERRRALEAREADLRKQELDQWEADLARREQELQERSAPTDPEAPPGGANGR